jgi:soluble P-type ATPase
MDLDVPGVGRLSLRHLVLDFTGTLSVGGVLIDGVGERLQELAKTFSIHVLTADTFGKARQALEGFPVQVTVMTESPEDRFKESYVERLGPDQVAAMGNGNNDRLMLKKACLGVAVLEGEGCSVEAFRNADLAVRDIRDGLDLLRQPLRIKAGLRS